MATLPEASVSINSNAGAFAGGTGYIVVMGCVSQNADLTPRVFASTQGMLDEHKYAPAIDYCALHFQKTRQPVIFIGLPIVTAGSIGSVDTSGVTGSSVITVTADTGGVMEEVDAVVTVLTGGTIGTDQIMLSLSLDGGKSSVTVRLGTQSTYTIPNVGLVLNFAAGTLAVADFATFRSHAPMWGSTALSSARAALAGQQNLARSWLVVGDLPNSTFAGYVTTEVDAYETANQRFVYARAQVTPYRLAKKSKVAGETLTFTTTTCTRSAGSWLLDGFAVGQSIAFTGTVSNNVTEAITVLTDTVLTVASGFASETISSKLVTGVQSSTISAYVSAQTAAFATVDAQKRIDLGLGRAFVQSPILGASLRRPAQWAASLREYQHDVQIPCWRKSDGPLDGFSLTDANGNTVEFDERYDGGALAGRFTCLRSYGNGPLGAFVALSLTRDTEGSLLSRTHNMAVADLACTVVQAETENAIGQVLQLNKDGTGSAASLGLIEQRVNRALQTNILQRFAEGPRATSAVWSASKTDVLNVPSATLNGTLALELNGTLEKIDTKVNIQTAGA
jgi:hypothetical protein